MTTYPKPEKRLVSLETARQWSPADYLIQVKCDGEFQTRELGGGRCVVAGEWMTARSERMLTGRHRELHAKNQAGFFVAFDLIEWRGDDVRHWPAGARWSSLQGLEMEGYFLPNMCLVDCWYGPDFVDRVLAGGGEGGVAKGWQDPYGPMLAVKQLREYQCIVTQIDHRLSVGIAERVGGVLLDRGRVTLGMNCDKVRVGSIIRVVAMDVFDSGKLREPRVKAGEWLISY